MRQGMGVVWTGWIDGLQRHIMAVNLESPWKMCLPGEDAITVPTDDFSQMVRLAQRGYVGLQEEPSLKGGGLRFVRTTMR